MVDWYAAEDPLRAERKSPDYPSHEAMLQASAFSSLETIQELEATTTTVETPVHRAYSISSTTPKRLGDRAAADGEKRSARSSLRSMDRMDSPDARMDALIARRRKDAGRRKLEAQAEIPEVSVRA